jgi:hypothetical protein
MATNEIKVFYSWQSDLSGSQTRNLIQSGIDSAVKALKNTVEIIADRDTKDVLGTPDITETIFNKIADSDIFVADIKSANGNTVTATLDFYKYGYMVNAAPGNRPGACAYMPEYEDGPYTYH